MCACALQSEPFKEGGYTGTSYTDSGGRENSYVDTADRKSLALPPVELAADARRLREGIVGFGSQWHWEDVVNIEDTELEEGEVFFSPAFGSIRVWMAFDEEETSEPVVAFVNCDSSNAKLFGQTATSVIDNHGRKGVNMTGLNISEYFKQKYKNHHQLPALLEQLPPVLVGVVADYAFDDEETCRFPAELRESLGHGFYYG